MARKKPIISPLGQWAYPGEVTIIPSSDITMKGVNYPVLGVDNLGNQQMMMPGQDYTFPGNYVTEYPQMQFGGMSKRKIDRILNENKDLNFVQRMYQPNTPSIMIPGQQRPSTHFMESADGRVYPTVVQMPDGTVQYLGDTAYDYANQTGQYIEFPNDRQARRFAKGYKKGTGVLEEFGKGGLAQWFDEKWVDVKTGKTCGRSGKDKNSRPYPACRPSKRVNETTPKTSSELSSAEKARFKREKTSGKRIDYNHKRREEGGETGWLDEYQTGGTLPPSYTSNPRKVQLYQDSLNLYNKYQPSFDKYKNWTRLNNIQTASLQGNDLFNQYWGPNKPKGPSPYNENIIIKPVEEMMHHYLRPRSGVVGGFTHLYEKPGNNYLETKISDYLTPNPKQTYHHRATRPDGQWLPYNVGLTAAQIKNNAARKNRMWPVSVTKEDFLDLGLTGVTPDLNSVFRFKKPVQPYVYKKPEVVPDVVNTPVVEPPKPSLFVSNIDRDMYTPNGGMAREYNIGVTLQDGNRKSFRTEKEFQDWKAANNLDISKAKVTEGRGYSYDYPENKKYGGWLDQFQTGGWAGWTPNVGKPYMRTSPAGNAGYSDNTRVVNQNTNVSAANRKAAEAAEYAKRVGSISQGETKSAYEKAREASSLVAQAQQRKGSADPLDYVLDMVNPATYAFAGSDLVGNTGSAISNTAQGNFKEAGSDLLNAGLNALYLLPAKGIAKAIASPMAFRPVEGMMYRGLGKEGFKDAVQSGVFRPKQLNYAPGRSLAERASSPKQFGSTYYAPSKKFGVIENYGPEYVAEVPYNEADFFRRYSKRNDWSYSTPRQIPITEGKILKKDWLLGYKPVDVSNIGQMSVAPPVGGHVKNIAKELLGLTRNKGNKAAIAEGNAWLKNWIDDPITQAKIDTDLGWIPQRGNVLKDKFDLGYEQAKSFRPNTKEYPISNQIQDLGESLFLKNPNEHMHAGNKGISYLYNKSPLERDLIKNNNAFDREYNSFVSRNPSISQNQRTLTTLHEGTHDWTSDFLLTESGQNQDVLNLLSPNTKVLSNQFNKLRNQGASSKEILKTMGKENAYKGYYATPTETHTKIMEIRKLLNMTPEQSKNLTPGQAKNIINILDQGENVTNINPKFLDIIDRDPKKLAYLFNRLWAVPAVAAASQLQEQKQGGQTSWLNKYK
jgi:hypothetical protein